MMDVGRCVKLVVSIAVLAAVGGCATTERGRSADVAGVWVATMPTADGSGRLLIVRLEPDGTAVLVTEFIGRGPVPPERGQWSTSGSRLRLTLPKEEPLEFAINGQNLVPETWDRQAWGEMGLPLVRAAVLSGTVTYHERMALPPDAILRVALARDPIGGSGTTLSVTTVRSDGRQVPLPFELVYDPNRVHARTPYGVFARLEAPGHVIFSGAVAAPDLTGPAAASPVDLVLHLPRGQAGLPSGGAVGQAPSGDGAAPSTAAPAPREPPARPSEGHP